MGTPARPIYFQEPQSFSAFPGCTNHTTQPLEDHRQAAANAKANGAAAWTFHTRTAFALHDRSYRAKMTQQERTELEALRGAVDKARWGLTVNN
jgi:hypothetical protein